MNNCIVKIQLNKGAKIPVYSTEQAAGADICACIDSDIVIKSGTWETIPTGVKIELPVGFEAQIRPRSGLAAKSGITVLNSPGTVDSDYRGEIKVILINHSRTDFVVKNGERIAQMVIAKHQVADFDVQYELTTTKRDTGGFGSTGV